MRMKLKSLLLGVALLGALFASAVPSVADVIPTGVQVTLTATADGTQPFTYQWQKAGVDIPGAVSASYVIAAFTASDAATYGVKISNSAGSISTTAILSQQVVPPSNPKIGIVQKVLAWIRNLFSRMFA